MSNFEQAMSALFPFEGGYSNDSHDQETGTCGITQPWLDYAIEKNIVPRETTLKTLLKEQSKNILKALCWDRLHLDNVITQSVANKIFIAAVNMDTYNTPSYRSVVCLQRAIRAATSHVLDEDGVLGIKTLECVNKAFSANLLASYRSEIAAYYRMTLQRHPEKECYRNGWMNRAYA